MHVCNQRSGDCWIRAAVPGAEGEPWNSMCFGVVGEIGQHLIAGHLYQGEFTTHVTEDAHVMELTALFMVVDDDDVEDEGDDAEGEEEDDEFHDDAEGEYDDEMSDASTSAGGTDFSFDDIDLDVMDDL